MNGEDWTRTYIGTPAHALLAIGPDTYVVGKLMLDDENLFALGAVDVAAEGAGTPQQGSMTIHLPAFDGGDVDGQRTARSDQEDADGEEGDGIGDHQHEKMDELDHTRAEVLKCSASKSDERRR